MTIADLIRTMSDEELASYCSTELECGTCPISKFCHECAEKTCELTWLAWLKQEVSE